jgi:hypothetical protein
MALDPSLLSGAINGPDDTSQSIFRRRAPATPGIPPALPQVQGIAGPATVPPPPTDATTALPGGARNLRAFGDTYPTIARDEQLRNAAQTGTGGIDLTGPAPASILASTTARTAPSAPFNLADTNAAAPGGITAPGPAPTPIGRAAGLVSAAVPTTVGSTGAGGITTLPPLSVTAPAPLADVGASGAQRGFLASNGVPIDQQTATAIGGDGSGDNAAAERRAAIRAGTAPGQNVRLGYDGTSRIYGTSSKPGGRIDTFTGIGTPDPNNATTRIDGASAVAANQVGLGLTPTQSAASAQVRASAANGGGITDLGGQLDNARDVANSAQRDINSNLSRAGDPFDPIGRQLTALRTQLGGARTRSQREALSGQINTILSGLVQGGSQSQQARQGVENAGIAAISGITNTNIQQGGETARTGMTQAGETQRLIQTQNAPQAEVTPDGKYRVRTGTTTAPVTGIDGNPVEAPLGAALSEGGRALQGYANQIGTAVANGTMSPEQAQEALAQGRNALVSGARIQGGIGSQVGNGVGAARTATGKDGTKYVLAADGKSWVKQ